MKTPGQDNIYLLGFMGSGKSTVAPLLAKRLNRICFDTDAWIETQTGKSIARIFRDHGEDYFRAKESECVKVVTEMKHLVVALGGGIVLKAENWMKIKSSGITIYLKCDLHEIWDRLRGLPATRPLLSGDSNHQLETIKKLLTQREPYYARADLMISSCQHESVEVTVKRIQEKLEGRIEDSLRRIG